jgi:hypothetical protein
VAASALLAAALGWAVLGQFYFFYRREYLWDGVVFHGLAMLCFVFAWRLIRPRKPRSAGRRSFRLEAWLRARPIPAALMALGLFLSFVATLLSWDRALDQSTGDVVVLWALGVGAAALAALWPAAWPPHLRRDWQARARGMSRDTWLEIVTIAGLTALALVLRIAALADVPYTLGGDEAWHGLLARQVLHGQLRNPFSMGYMSMPTFFYWPVSWSLWLVGDNVVGLRLPAALVGTVTVPILYLFARDLWGRRTAFVSALLLATYDYHVHFSRLGANNVWDPLFVVLALWALDRGLREEHWNAKAGGQGRRERFFVLTGMVMGLSTLFYTSARLLPLLVVVYTGFVWLQERASRIRSNDFCSDDFSRLAAADVAPPLGNLGLPLLLLILAFLVAAGPMLGYALAHPDEWNARINQVGIFQSGWLAREPGLTGKSTLQIVAEQFLRAAGAFHVFADRTVWYGAERPLLGFVAGLFAVLGMAWAVAHWRERRYFLALIWFWSVIITGGMLTESPPSSQRLVIAIPAVVLLVTFGLEQSIDLAWRLLRLDRKWKNIALGLLALALAVSSVRFYFAEFTPTRRYGSENGETATMIGHYLRELDGDYQAYFFGAPRIYWSFGTMSFLAPNVPGQDVEEPLTAPPTFVDTSRNAVFIFLPERAGELAWVQQAFPEGRLREFDDAGGRLRFVAYEVPYK